MTAALIALIATAGGLALAAHVALFLVAYAPVAHRRRTWQDNPPEMASFQENNIGVDPETAYLYAALDVREDEAVVVEGRVDPVTPYASMTLYDRYLQGAPGPTGPTHLNHVDLRPNERGVFRAVLAHRDPGGGCWMDLGGRRRGVVAWRQAEGEVTPPTLRVVPLSEVLPAEVSSGSARLKGFWTWRATRAVYVAWMTVQTLTRHDFIFTLAAGQDAADFNRFERLGERMELDPVGRRLARERRPAPCFDIARHYAPGTLGAHVRDHFDGPAQDVTIPPTGFPMSERGMWAKARWRHMHDLRHVLLGLGTTVPEEIVLHGFQLGQHFTWTGVIVMFFGTLLSIRDGVPPWRLVPMACRAYRHGRGARLLVAEPVEDWGDQLLDEVRARVGIVPIGQRYGAAGPFPPPGVQA